MGKYQVSQGCLLPQHVWLTVHLLPLSRPRVCKAWWRGGIAARLHRRASRRGCAISAPMRAQAPGLTCVVLGPQAAVANAVFGKRKAGRKARAKLTYSNGTLLYSGFGMPKSKDYQLVIQLLQNISESGVFNGRRQRRGDSSPFSMSPRAARAYPPAEFQRRRG
jgi:hypothetical protein